MLWYVAFISALNLGAGYYWGAHLRRCPRCALVRGAESLTSPPPAVRMAAGQEVSSNSATAAEGIQIAAAFDAAGGISGGANQPTTPIDASTGLVTREYAEQLLAKMADTDSGGAPATIALVEVNRVTWADNQSQVEMDERLFRGVSTIMLQSLDQKHTAASFADQQALLLVPNEDVHQATRRAEELRQRVASTEFVADGQPFQTTVTCALAEISKERSGPRLFEFLQEALGEAKRYGGNRTFMHDGNSPTPVVPSEQTVAPQQLAI